MSKSMNKEVRKIDDRIASAGHELYCANMIDNGDRRRLEMSKIESRLKLLRETRDRVLGGADA